MAALIGVKLGMTQFFSEDGRSCAVTLIQAGPCVVLKRMLFEEQGYAVLLLGYGEYQKAMSKPVAGVVSQSGEVFSKRYLKEFKVSLESQFEVGDQIHVDVFNPGDKVNIRGAVKGRGFQGSIKRHGFHRGPMTHGSRHHRSPGSIGVCYNPSRVLKGKKLPGRMGGYITVRNLGIMKVDRLVNAFAVRGAVPGFRGQLLYISQADNFHSKVQVYANK